MRDLIRQGDILFKPLAADRDIADGATRLAEVAGKVIAKGEVTGHAHRISEGAATIVEERRTWGTVSQPTGTRYLRVHETATVAHEEHKPVTLLPGLYEIMQAREYDYVREVTRRVVD